MSEDRSTELFKNNPENTKLFSNGTNNTNINGDNNTITNTVNHYHKTPKIENKITPDESHISGNQVNNIKALINEIVEKEVIGGMVKSKAFAKWHKQLQRYMNVSSHLLIKEEDYDKAISYLKQYNALKRSKTRRRDIDYWKKDLYKAIYAKSNELNISKQELYNIVNERYNKNITSLKELGEQNLDKLRRYLFSIK